MSLLALQSVSKSYGALKVTDDISLSVTEGETLAILGLNGAGKTTLFNLISGDARCDRGSVHYEGRDITALKPHQRCRLGLGRSYQVPQPFGARGLRRRGLRLRAGWRALFRWQPAHQPGR